MVPSGHAHDPRIVFSDFDEFADSIRGIAGRFIPTARSERDWWLAVAPVGGIELQQLQIGGPATYAGDGTPNTLTLGIPLTDARRIRIDGEALEANSLIYLRRDQPFTFAAGQTTRWGGITIPLGQTSELFDTERVMASLAPATRAQSSMKHLNLLRQLLARVGAVRNGLDQLDAAAAQSVEEDVLHAVLQTIEASSVTPERRSGRPRVRRTRIIGDMVALIDAKRGQPLLMNDLCKATRVSERTLRNVFMEYFGISPMRFVKTRQLLEIRRALLATDPERGAIRRIASSFGVYDFSLLAQNYKALFGETPSESLHKPPPKRAAANASWIAHAARLSRR